MKPVAILVAAAALAGYNSNGVEAFQPRANAPRMSAAAAPKAAAAGADKKSEEPLLLRAAKGEVRRCGCLWVGWMEGVRGWESGCVRRLTGPRAAAGSNRSSTPMHPYTHP